MAALPPERSGRPSASLSSAGMRRSRIGIFALLLPLVACRSTDTPILSDDAVTLDLPLVKQDELHECGLSAISALAQYWQLEISPELRARLAQQAAEEEGLTGGELRSALESIGMETFLFHGTLDRAETGLYRHVDAGRPLLVMFSIGEEKNHYGLFLGYDEPRKTVVLLDPARGEVVRRIEVFERSWNDCNQFTLLAVPKSQEEALPTGPGPLYRGPPHP
jgi:ABC-type bacteriocin/lantibiotic exporter with double-glycine peptidase domain